MFITKVKKNDIKMATYKVEIDYYAESGNIEEQRTQTYFIKSDIAPNDVIDLRVVKVEEV